MSKKSFLSGRDKELQDIAEIYETAQTENKPIYLDADDMADLADWYAHRHKIETAKKIADYGLDMHPENTALLVQKAYLHLSANEVKKAQEAVSQIKECSSEVLVLKANILMKEGNAEEAESMLNLIEDKDSLANIIDIAYMYIDLGYPDKAQEWLKRGTIMYAENEAYLAASGDCYYSKGLYDDASVCYNKLIDKNPYSSLYWFGLARCYFDQQIFDKAIEACDYAIIADDEFADAYVMRGHAYFHLDNEESAMENYSKAVKLDAMSPAFIHTFIGLNKAAKREWEDGLKHLEIAIATHKSNDTIALPTVYGSAALCLYKLKKKRKAHQYCKKAIALAPDDIEAYLIEGRIYMEDGNYEKGAKLWAKALDLSPTADTWHDIGADSLEIGQLGYAKLAFEHVKSLDPEYDGINEKLTSLYMVLRDKENFMKYNQLCKTPFKMEELEKLMSIFEKENNTDLAELMKNIVDSLK